MLYIYEGGQTLERDLSFFILFNIFERFLII